MCLASSIRESEITTIEAIGAYGDWRRNSEALHQGNIAAKKERACSKLAIIGTIEVTPGRSDQLLPLLLAHRARCLKDEPGTLQLEVLTPHEDDIKVLLYEVYRDDAAFDVHRNGPSIAQWREETAGMIAKVYVTRCALVA
ncbi:MAG: putative quinol monooxygenase [Rhodoplanes sp.]